MKPELDRLAMLKLQDAEPSATACTGDCQQGRNCNCRIAPARGIVNGIIIAIMFWSAAYLIWSSL